MCFVAVVNEESHDTSEAHHAAKKALLSNLIQSVLMSALLEMDTMQTWVHILLGKKIPERGAVLLSAPEPVNGEGKLVWLSSLTSLRKQEPIIHVRAFFFAKSRSIH